METKDIEGYKPSLWLPERDQARLAALGKLAEECGELVAIVSRCVIQGIDGKDPETGESNLDALQKEIADVNGLSKLIIDELSLDPVAILDRAEKKRKMKEEWLVMIDRHYEGEL